MYKYVQKKLTPSFHCLWYLKISSGSEMFNNCCNYDNYSAGCTCEAQKSYSDVWMREREEYCNDGWMFLNKSPTMMCLAKKAEKRKKKKSKHNQHQYLRFTYLQLRKVWTGVFSFVDHFSPKLKWSNHKYMSNSLLWHTCLGATDTQLYETACDDK